MAGKSDAKFVGVDWAIKGWFAIGFDEDGGYEFSFGGFRDLIEHYSNPVLMLVDIPIGLPPQFGLRQCDREAKGLLGKREGSVFPVVNRELARTAQQARQREHRQFLQVLGEVNSASQEIPDPAWNIAPMIAEVDVVMSELDARGRECVREVHPELCFWALNNEQPMSYWKKNKQGRGLAERIRALEPFEPRVRKILGDARMLHPSQAAEDDILDALVAAVTARLGYPDKLQTLPAKPPKDAHGLPMEMVFYNPTR